MFSICRDPRFWENPLEFLPERFLDSNIGYEGKHFEYLTFGSGRRICPGLQYGVTIVDPCNLLYAFDWELTAGMVASDMGMSRRLVLFVTKKLHSLSSPELEFLDQQLAYLIFTIFCNHVIIKIKTLQMIIKVQNSI